MFFLNRAFHISKSLLTSTRMQIKTDVTFKTPRPSTQLVVQKVYNSTSSKNGDLPDALEGTVDLKKFRKTRKTKKSYAAAEPISPSSDNLSNSPSEPIPISSLSTTAKLPSGTESLTWSNLGISKEDLKRKITDLNQVLSKRVQISGESISGSISQALITEESRSRPMSSDERIADLETKIDSKVAELQKLENKMEQLQEERRQMLKLAKKKQNTDYFKCLEGDLVEMNNKGKKIENEITEFKNELKTLRNKESTNAADKGK